jgi:hypothetical protein
MNSYSEVEFWKTQSTDNPSTVNGFRGTWKFSDHSLIPDTFNNFLLEYFYQYPKINKIPLEKINEVMNQVWEGPGSMVKIAQLTEELRLKRTVERPISSKIIKDEDVRSIDDDEEEFELNLDQTEEVDEEGS